MAHRYISLTDFVQNGLIRNTNPPKDTDTDCPCCHEPYTSQPNLVIVSTPCNHTFHEHCLLTWLRDHNKNWCPYCRRSLFSLASPQAVSTELQTRVAVLREGLLSHGSSIRTMGQFTDAVVPNGSQAEYDNRGRLANLGDEYQELLEHMRRVEDLVREVEGNTEGEESS